MTNAMEHIYTFQVIAANGATVRAAPDRTSSRLGSVLQGQTVYADKIITGVDGFPWVEVATGTRMSNGATLPGIGYIFQSLLELKYNKAPTTGAPIPPAPLADNTQNIHDVSDAIALLREVLRRLGE